MPFYGGNIRYKAAVDVAEISDVTVRVSRYRGALVKVYMDGLPLGIIAYPPYMLTAENVCPGGHVFEFELFGTRINTSVHCTTAEITTVVRAEDLGDGGVQFFLRICIKTRRNYFGARNRDKGQVKRWSGFYSAPTFTLHSCVYLSINTLCCPIFPNPSTNVTKRTYHVYLLTL